MNIELKRALYNITSLADLGHAVTSADNFTVKVQSMLYVIMGTLLAGKGAIFLYERNRGLIVPIAHKGIDETGHLELAVSLETLLLMKKNEPCGLCDGETVALPLPYRNMLGRTGTAIFVPLWVRDEFIGAIILGHKFSLEPYSTDDFELLRIIANQIAITLNNHALFTGLSEQLEENRRLYEEMRRIYHDTIQAFAAAIDAKDGYTKHHSQRVAKYAVAIARELGWNESDTEGIYIAGFLHDVGKIVINSELLNKKEPLTEKEMFELRNHPVLSYDIISKIKFPWKDVVGMIRHHHERFDGRGYPDEVTGDDLSEGARILTLADSFDAMTSDRPYRTGLDLKGALEELRKCRDAQFDCKVVAALCRVLEKEINGELPEPDILPHLDRDFDLSIIAELLEVLTEELSS
jgi:putative nucleotidyltransferase with HDIG domain